MHFYGFLGFFSTTLRDILTQKTVVQRNLHTMVITLFAHERKNIFHLFLLKNLHMCNFCSNFAAQFMG